jgi:predicted NUDIX family NTP pyrophosphohydrolase
VWVTEGLGTEKFKGSNLILTGKFAGRPENNAGAYFDIEKAKNVIHKYQRPLLDDLKKFIS